LGPHFCIENPSLIIARLMPWRGSLRNVILLRTHNISDTFHQKVLSPLLAVHIRHFGCVNFTDRSDQTSLSANRVYRLVPSLPVYHSRELIEHLSMKFPHPRQIKNKLSYTCIQSRHMVCMF
jgi:hypothetical protein